MKEIITKFTKSSIISSLALIVLAILLIVQSDATIIGISYIIGAVLVAIGALAEINYVKNIKEKSTGLDIVYGIVCVILGVLVIKNPKAIASIIPLVVGFIIVINSAIKLQYSIELKKRKNDLWLSTLILSIIMTICGIVLIFNPFEGLVIFTRIVGIFILIYAVLDLISTFVIKNTFKKLQEAITEKVEKESPLIEESEVKEAEIEEPEEEQEDKKKKAKKSEEEE